mmetsp:Transcript_9656/g.24401  ORF Transcript_9656/g.24401 Transcript_9656/m.24401 type:complete len:280 (+) Transcript_9656:759-1598(+)
MCDWLSTICFVDVGGAMDPPGSCGPNAELGMITGCSCRFSNSSTCCLSFADARIFSIGVKKLGITSLSSSPSSSGSSTLTAFCCCCCFLLALSSFIACAFCSSALAANVVFFSSSFSSSTLLVAFVLLLSFRFCNSLAFASAVNDASLILAISASFRSTSDIDFFEGTAASSPVVVAAAAAAAVVVCCSFSFSIISSFTFVTCLEISDNFSFCSSMKDLSTSGWSILPFISSKNWREPRVGLALKCSSWNCIAPRVGISRDVVAVAAGASPLLLFSSSG